MLETRKTCVEAAGPTGSAALHAIGRFRSNSAEFVSASTRVEMCRRLASLEEDIAAGMRGDVTHRLAFWRGRNRGTGILADIPRVLLEEFFFALAAHRNVLANELYFLSETNDKACGRLFGETVMAIDTQFEWFRAESSPARAVRLFGAIDDTTAIEPSPFLKLYERGEAGWFHRDEQHVRLYSTVPHGGIGVGRLIVAQKSGRLVAAFSGPLPTGVFILGDGGALQSAAFRLLQRLPVGRDATVFGDLSPFEVSRFIHLLTDDPVHTWSWRGVGIAAAKAGCTPFAALPRLRQRRRETQLWRALSARFRPLLEAHFCAEELAVLDGGDAIHVEALFGALPESSRAALWSFVGLAPTGTDHENS